MKKTHNLKVWIKYYDSLIDGSKTFDFRVDDRDFEIGDKLILEEYNDKLDKYTGRKTEREIVYILRKSFNLKENQVILGLNTLKGFILKIPTEKKSITATSFIGFAYSEKEFEERVLNKNPFVKNLNYIIDDISQTEIIINY